MAPYSDEPHSPLYCAAVACVRLARAETAAPFRPAARVGRPFVPFVPCGGGGGLHHVDTSHLRHHLRHSGPVCAAFFAALAVRVLSPFMLVRMAVCACKRGDMTGFKRVTWDVALQTIAEDYKICLRV